MSADNAQREPTMEEILASIRRIISEDDQEGGGEGVLELGQEEGAGEEDMSAAMFGQDGGDDDIIAMDHADDDADAFAAFGLDPEPAPEPAPAPVAPPKPAAATAARAPSPAPVGEDSLLEDEIASQAAGALGRLFGTMTINANTTLEDLVRDMLRPMLKQWLDANLTTLVEREVEKEIARIRRLAR